MASVVHELCRPASKLRIHPGQWVYFHECLMALARRNAELPKEGLGATRFAMQHRAALIPGAAD